MYFTNNMCHWKQQNFVLDTYAYRCTLDMFLHIKVMFSPLRWATVKYVDVVLFILNASQRALPIGMRCSAPRGTIVHCSDCITGNRKCSFWYILVHWTAHPNEGTVTCDIKHVNPTGSRAYRRVYLVHCKWTEAMSTSEDLSALSHPISTSVSSRNNFVCLLIRSH